MIETQRVWEVSPRQIKKDINKDWYECPYCHKKGSIKQVSLKAFPSSVEAYLYLNWRCTHCGEYWQDEFHYFCTNEGDAND